MGRCQNRPRKTLAEGGGDPQGSKLITWNCKSLNSIISHKKNLDANVLCTCIVETWNNAFSFNKSKFVFYSTGICTSKGNGAALLAMRKYPSTLIFSYKQNAIGLLINSPIGQILPAGIYINLNPKYNDFGDITNMISTAITANSPKYFYIMGDFNKNESILTQSLSAKSLQIFAKIPISRRKKG